MKRLFTTLAAVLLAIACEDITEREYPSPTPSPQTITDGQATAETQNLLKNLRLLGENGRTMFGHQASTLYGIGWGGVNPRRSDIETLYGDFAAVTGYELAGIELGNDENIDGDNFDDIRTAAVEGFKNGGVATVSWHVHNPVTDISYDTANNRWDNTPAANKVIPGGELHDKYCGWVDKLADYLKTFIDENGTPVPILFRPYHEHTGDGFWWGKGNCTADEYIALWRFTVERLRDVNGIHNLLYVYSPNKISSYDAYLEFWPGDDYVDILGLDAYEEQSNWTLPEEGVRLLRLLKHIAAQKNKPCAFTETGLENNTSKADWWTANLAVAMENIPITYVLVWRNAATNHFFGPYPGCVSAEDFKKFADDPRILFEKDIQGIYE